MTLRAFDGDNDETFMLVASFLGAEIVAVVPCIEAVADLLLVGGYWLLTSG